VIDSEEINQRTAKVALLLRERLGIGGRDLGHAMKRAGRLLPRRVRRAGAKVAQMQMMAGNPKLARMLDPAALTAALDEISRHLMTVDASDRRKRKVLEMLGSLAFVFLVIAGAMLVWLNWRGYL
jgi:hypothetical protein